MYSHCLYYTGLDVYMLLVAILNREILSYSYPLCIIQSTTIIKVIEETYLGIETQLKQMTFWIILIFY